MIDIFKAAIKAGASDLHMKTGDFLRARINGELVPMTQQRLTHEQIKQVATQLIPHQKDRDQIDGITDYDCSWGAPGVGRFRVNILRQRGTLMIVMRVIPIEIPTFEQLELPLVLARLAMNERGLVLVTGVTGSGKSTSLAAMIGYLNMNRRRHIITLEN
ncbi:MAG TPA: ATPase, T2SS/T4P/T4SS family, partial [Longimicrobiales bacterium]